jgi:hypothetical protein
MTAPSASVVADNARVDSEPADESVGAVRDFFDALGAAEWDRLVESPSARVALELHRRFLRRFVQPGWRVLEVGAHILFAVEKVRHPSRNPIQGNPG